MSTPESWTSVQPLPVCEASQGNLKEAYKKTLPKLLEWIALLPLPAGAGYESMLSFDFLLGAALHASLLPGLAIVPAPVFPAQPVVGAAAAAPLLVMIYKSEVDLFSAYVANLNAVKAVLIREFGPILSQLEQGAAGLSRRTNMEIFAEAHKLLGILTTSDSRALREATLEPFSPGIIVSSEIQRLKGKHALLLTLGPDYAAGTQDKLFEATKLICDSNDKARTIVEQYVFETPVAARTFDSLTTYVIDRLERLGTKELVESRGIGFHHGPVAAAAAASTTLGTGQNPTHAALQAFYDAAPIGKYCFLHGYCPHDGRNCRVMWDRSKKACISPYTVQHVDAKKPGKISGIDGATSVWPGFKTPN